MQECGTRVELVEEMDFEEGFEGAAFRLSGIQDQEGRPAERGRHGQWLRVKESQTGQAG